MMRSARRSISAAARRENVSSTDALSVDAVDDEMRDAMGKRIGFARASARNDEQWSGNVCASAVDTMFHRAALRAVE